MRLLPRWAPKRCSLEEVFSSPASFSMFSCVRFCYFLTANYIINRFQEDLAAIFCVHILSVYVCVFCSIFLLSSLKTTRRFSVSLDHYRWPSANSDRFASTTNANGVSNSTFYSWTVKWSNIIGQIGSNSLAIPYYLDIFGTLLQGTAALKMPATDSWFLVRIPAIVNKKFETECRNFCAPFNDGKSKLHMFSLCMVVWMRFWRDNEKVAPTGKTGTPDISLWPKKLNCS